MPRSISLTARLAPPEITRPDRKFTSSGGSSTACGALPKPKRTGCGDDRIGADDECWRAGAKAALKGADEPIVYFLKKVRRLRGGQDELPDNNSTGTAGKTEGSKVTVDAMAIGVVIAAIGWYYRRKTVSARVFIS